MLVLKSETFGFHIVLFLFSMFPKRRQWEYEVDLKFETSEKHITMHPFKCVRGRTRNLLRLQTFYCTFKCAALTPCYSQDWRLL